MDLHIHPEEKKPYTLQIPVLPRCVYKQPFLRVSYSTVWHLESLQETFS